MISGRADDKSALCEGFMADYNVRFGQEPRNSKDMHRPFCEYETRPVSHF